MELVEVRHNSNIKSLHPIVSAFFINNASHIIRLFPALYETKLRIDLNIQAYQVIVPDTYMDSSSVRPRRVHATARLCVLQRTRYEIGAREATYLPLEMSRALCWA